MTGIWIMSDLHVDAAAFDLPAAPAAADVLVIAGDVGDGHHKAIRWLQQHAVQTGLPVVFVAGNHDYYAGDLVDDCAEQYSAIGVTLLHAARPSVEIGGVRFVGSTLWTDYAISGDVTAAMWWSKQYFPDFLNIDVGMRRCRATDLVSAHRLQRGVLELVLEESFDGPTVVVTHHAPHVASLRYFVATKPSDGSYASNLGAVIDRYRPALWIHGHVHQSRDYIVMEHDVVMSSLRRRHNAGGTRVVCNPRGDAAAGKGLENKDFQPDLVIEI